MKNQINMGSAEIDCLSITMVTGMIGRIQFVIYVVGGGFIQRIPWQDVVTNLNEEGGEGH